MFIIRRSLYEQLFQTQSCDFCRDKYYQIMMPCEKSCLFFIKVGDKFYYDESNSIMCSRNKIHKVEVPADELNNAKEYADMFLR